MKAVLFSVLMLTAAVHAAPKHARLSCTSTAAQRRRHALLKGEKYSEGLPTGDPFPGRMGANKHYRFRELFLPGSERRGFRRGKDRSYSPHDVRRKEDAKPGFLSKFHGSLPKESVLNFRSPEQLQEYLFSEAANAKHILRSGAAFYSPSNHLERGSDYFPRPSRGSDVLTTNRHLSKVGDSGMNNTSDGHRTTALGKFNRNGRRKPRRPNHIPFYENWMENREKFLDMEENKNAEYFGPKDRHYFRLRRPFLHPYEMPYLYLPPWYDPRTPLYGPRMYLSDRKLYKPPSYSPRSTPKPNREMALGDDIVKLKQLVDELDALSEEGQNGGTSNGKSDAEKHEKEKNETIAEMKEKIDKVIIPMLNKISKDLNASAATGSPPPKKAESSDGEQRKGKDVRDKEKEKEVDNKEEPHLKNNFPCRIDGLWVCTADALHLNISTMPNMTLKVTVVSENPKKTTSITKDWAINGITLASTGGPFLLAAICPEKRKVANFIGQCRSCRDEDIISGLWTFSTAGRDCTEIFTSFETKIDVFRRDKSQQRKVEKSSRALAEE